jgi:hypothetical protein
MGSNPIRGSVLPLDMTIFPPVFFGLVSASVLDGVCR